MNSVGIAALLMTKRTIWRVTAVDTRRDRAYTGHGSKSRQLVQDFADEPTAHRAAQLLILPDTRWAYASVEEIEVAL